jgi:hypothetical protein
LKRLKGKEKGTATAAQGLMSTGVSYMCQGAGETEE